MFGTSILRHQPNLKPPLVPLITTTAPIVKTQFYNIVKVDNHSNVQQHIESNSKFVVELMIPTFRTLLRATSEIS